LKYRQTEPERSFLYRRHLLLVPPALRPVRLGENRRDFVAFRDCPLQRWNGECGRAQEHEFHRGARFSVLPWA
jgi:hypothetical protein